MVARPTNPSSSSAQQKTAIFLNTACCFTVELHSATKAYDALKRCLLSVGMSVGSFKVSEKQDVRKMMPFRDNPGHVNAQTADSEPMFI